ncbi:hypothetical protein [Mycobacteroides abscessus]|uniref:Uncharacterized protein n=1 Tax=Mycobacteroides abscessus MAB_091912_2446 TaxID=1335414 RepID=A0A829M2A2_9MYCO|nr:hypothetical protein [Mycobacteroides abscessus]ESV58964.1 hypothetical protein L830_4816 [Mycobacteroides abscessus MAB_082312_2258]ESV62349.1 hypothetical protein L833_4754 [Mycobacteroides abscessus MAB_091912_2446]QSM04511.1 hypothetical protein PROPHIGD02-2_114 [Mycobacterium phage prophiGD02-2]QST87384.1 hypothetical protein PROPHIGD90-1_114 [Mycobacterium phage prophiGD90-1]AWG55525.1 hypothetical protein DDT53_15720 [Mycobacteroides abscessus]
MFTVAQLRKAINDLPDDMLVMTEDGESPMSDANLYIAPACRHRIGSNSWVSEGHEDPPATELAREVFGECENTHVLLVTRFGNDGQDITPEEPGVIDVQVEQTAIESG